MLKNRPSILKFNLGSTRANIAWAILSQIVEKAAGYLILAVLTRTLLKTELGAFFFALSIAELSAVLLNFGTDTYLIRRVSTDPGRALEHLSQVLSMRLVNLGIGYGLLNLFIGSVKPELFAIMLLVGAYDFLEEIYYSISAFLTGMKQLLYRVTLLGGFKILTFAGVYFVARFTHSLIPVLWTVLLFDIALVVSAMALIRIRFGALGFQFDLAKNLHLMRLAMPFFFFNLLTILHMRFDTVLVGTLLGLQQVANYELGIKMMEVARFIVRPLHNVFFPLFSEYVANGQWQKIQRRFAQLAMLSFGGGLLLAIGMWTFASQAIALLFGPGYDESILPSQILFLSIPFLFLGFVLNITSNALHQEKKAAMILGFSVLINMGLNMFVIPLYGITGAAWITVLSQIVWALGMLLLVLPGLFSRKLKI